MALTDCVSAGCRLWKAGAVGNSRIRRVPVDTRLRSCRCPDAHRGPAKADTTYDVKHQVCLQADTTYECLWLIRGGA